MNDTKGLVEEIEDLLNGNWFGEASTYINHVDSLLERALTALKAQGWQDIATAPRDCTWVLLWSHDDEAPGSWKYSFGAWVNESATAWHDGAFGPTHWMPLPQPPKEPNNKEEA